MTAVFRHAARDREARTRRRPSVPFEDLDFVISHAAKGIATAVERTARPRHRGDPSAPPLEHGLDLFHTTRGAQRVPTRARRRARSLQEGAESRDAEVGRAEGRGIDAPGPARRARAARSRAIEAPEEVGRFGSAWRRCRAAIEPFRPAGRLDDRARAGAEIEAGASEPTGPEWREVRNFLADRRSRALPDRIHERRAAAAPRRGWREALAWRGWRRRGGSSDPAPSGSSDPARSASAAMAYAAAMHLPLQEAGRAADGRVAAIPEDPVRAGGAVGCMDGVSRMRRSRHRQMTRPMLDLKRLDWNRRPSRSGRRGQKCPSQASGSEWPTYDFWTVRRSDRADSTQGLSTSGIAT
jgi:hypothetical protein